ncbi:MAG TPA: response regulator [Spirochaetota bacterium]|nr:response regulator [Spirochaetota bacterium]
MLKPSDGSAEKKALREKIMGLGDSSLKKNYYPQLQDQVDSLEKTKVNLKKAIKKSTANESLFKALFDNAIDGIVLADVETKKLDLFNKSFLSMLGYSSESHLELSLYDIHPEDKLESVIDQFNRIASGTTKMTRNIPVKKSDGSLIYCDITGTPIELNGRDYIIGIFRDMTEARKSAIEKNAFETRLHHIQKMEAIGTLAGGVAHDFNNILTAIMGLTELSINTPSVVGPVRKNLEQILQSCYRARDLVSQLLSISYKGEKKLEPLNLTPVIKDAVSLIRATLPATILIRTIIDAELDTVLADKTQINQILINLCTNAAHSMDLMEGEITIKLLNMYIDNDYITTHPGLKEGWHVLIEVTDNGSGISPDIIDRIFEPFFTTKEKGKGTGLGLSVIHGIVNNHKGSISVQSEPGKGTVFEVFLPVTGEPSRHMEKTIEKPHSGNATILLVDDEKMLTEINSSILESMGYTVLTCNNGSEALEIFRNHPGTINLVITDMTMPGMTGLHLTSEIRKINPHIPVLLCTGFNEQLTREKTEAAGIYEILMKPFTSLELGQAIKRGLSC